MKMTKIESARIIVGQKGRCPVTLKCKTCFTKNGVCGSVENRLALAEAYIKRHESKSKKKDHILDTTKKVEEPKPITVGIDNSDVTLALTAHHDPIPLQIAKMIRDNGYSCINLSEKDIVGCKINCPMRLLCREYKHNSNNNLSDYIFKVKKQLIDDYISANEPVKDCPVNSEIPQPIKLPDFVYSASKNGVGFIDTKNRTFNTNDKGELLINDKPCFATPEEALRVAKKLWNGEVE